MAGREPPELAAEEEWILFQHRELAGIGKYLDGEGVYVATMHAGGRSLEMISMLQPGIDSGRQLGRRHDGDVGDLAPRDPFGRIFYPDYLAAGEPELLDLPGLGREFEQVGGDPANPGSQGARRQHGGAQRLGRAPAAEGAGRKGRRESVAVSHVNVVGS